MAGPRCFWITLGAIVLGVALLLVDLLAQGGGGTTLVTLCHRAVTPNGTTYTTVSVPAATVASHLAHGDYLGACVVSPSR